METTQRPACKFFNVYDVSGELRKSLEVACKQEDLTRSQLVRRAVRYYLKHEVN